MAVPFVEMHRSLSRLTWQAEQVARGDYSQRSDFIGDFSRAFNTMIEQLAEREGDLRAEITRRRQTEERLQLERDLLVSGPLVTFRWDPGDEGLVQYVSPNVTTFGYEPEEFTARGRTYDSIVHAEDIGWITADGNANAARGLEGWTQEYRLIDRSGKTRWVRDYTHAVRDAGGEVVCYEGYVIDVSAQKAEEEALRRREEQLRVLSLQDELTGLYNRRGLLAVGGYALRAARRHKAPVSLVALDIDGLRAINDRYGNERGDDALRELAAALRATTREADVVARSGGDDFAVLVEQEPGVAAQLVARLERRLAAREHGGRSFALSVRTGIATWDPQQQADVVELLERATRELRAGG